MHPLRFNSSLIAVDLIKHLPFSEILRLLLSNAASIQHFYLLACSLSTLPAHKPAKFGGDDWLRMTDQDIKLLYDQIPALPFQDKRTLLSRILF
jgi:hypothetical protein